MLLECFCPLAGDTRFDVFVSRLSGLIFRLEYFYIRNLSCSLLLIGYLRLHGSHFSNIPIASVNFLSTNTTNCLNANYMDTYSSIFGILVSTTVVDSVSASCSLERYFHILVKCSYVPRDRVWF